GAARRSGSGGACRPPASSSFFSLPVRSGPEVLCRVAPPGAPPLGRGEEPGGRRVAERAPQPEIRVRERIRPAQRPERYILRRPLADPRDLLQPLDGPGDVAARPEPQLSARDGLGEGDGRRGPGARQPERDEFGRL